MNFKRFPDFRKELRRPFEVHAICYDCAEFYDGCEAWPAGKPLACSRYNRLPDVLPGTCGQKFPETRRRAERPAEQGQGSAPAEKKRQPQRTRPRGEPHLCECGATLPKGRRLCDPCRATNRRTTMRETKRRYRASRAATQPDSHVPFPDAQRCVERVRSDDIRVRGLPVRPP